MTSNPGEGWKVFADGDDSDNVPLWKALALFTSDDLDQGLQANAAVINQAKPPYVRYYNVAFVVSMFFGFLFVVFLLALLLSVRSGATDLLSILTLSALTAAAMPHLCRQLYQFGIKTPDAPLTLPHPPDRHFDELLGYLQKASGPSAYYLSRFRKKRIFFKRRQFFGKLRYFLFSEHSADRAIVMRFRTGLSLPADIFLHRDDVEKILAMSSPKRRGGPGRNVKYAYVEAVFDLHGDRRLDALNLNDEAAAVRSITDCLSEWFDSAANMSGEIPKRDQLSPYAKKIYDHLKNLAAPKTP